MRDRTPNASTLVEEFPFIKSVMQCLLHDMMTIVDSSIPNKEQNRALKNVIHDKFDASFLYIVREAYSEHIFDPPDHNEHSIMPCALFGSLPDLWWNRVIKENEFGR